MAGVKIAILVVSVILNCASCEKVVFCYYGTWATYRHGLGKFDVDHINTDFCTHLVYAFAGISSQGAVVSLDPYLDLPDNWGRDNFRQFTDLKKKNPKLKTLLAVGGWNEGSYKYSVMAANADLRKIFISSVLSMLNKFNFDGLDLDWEYPNRRDTVYGKEDIANYSNLLKELREVFDKYGYLLTSAVSSVRDSASLSYDIPTISKYLDYINIMTYDMHGAWDSVTGHNAALHKGEGDEGYDRKSLYTVDVALEYWLEQGCPPEKIVLGVPFYGRTFTLKDANVSSVRAPANGAGLAGPYTATNGFMGYNEFCNKLQTESWTVKFDAQAKVPYAFRNKYWVSYDDPDSIRSKVEFGLKYNITGIMVWSIETDDFHNLCGGGDFPLLRTVNNALYGYSSANESASISSTLSTSTVSTSTVSSSTVSSSTVSSSTVSSSTISSTTVSTSTASSSTASSSTASNNAGNSSMLTSTDSSSTSKETTPATSDSSDTTENSLICKEEGYEADPTDCACFYVCVRDVSGNLTPVKFNCPSSLYWDKNLNVCNYPYLTECNVMGE